MKRAALALVLLLVAAIALPPLYYAVFPEPTPELPAAGRRVEVSDGLGVNVIDAGDGAPVVLVHGHPGCSYDWTPTLREVAARGRRAIAYDRVGYGRSDGRRKEPQAPRSEAQPSEVRNGGFVRVGPPEPVMSILAGPVLSWVASVPPAWQRFGRAFSGAAFHPDPVPDWFRIQAAANFARPQTLDTFRSEGRDLGGEADLDPGPIALPIAVVHGDADQLVPFAVAEAIAARAPHAELHRVERAGHMLPVTHAALLADVITGR